mmetsp:Transcript_107302/g.185137  ORF Transcript_107302/g.185137 Transcript_107302/m.185137 type:complete len:240 (-) Transcript_107302:143-862(-)
MAWEPKAITFATWRKPHRCKIDTRLAVDAHNLFCTAWGPYHHCQTITEVQAKPPPNLAIQHAPIQGAHHQCQETKVYLAPYPACPPRFPWGGLGSAGGVGTAFGQHMFRVSLVLLCGFSHGRPQTRIREFQCVTPLHSPCPPLSPCNPGLCSGCVAFSAAVACHVLYFDGVSGTGGLLDMCVVWGFATPGHVNNYETSRYMIWMMHIGYQGWVGGSGWTTDWQGHKWHASCAPQSSPHF